MSEIRKYDYYYGKLRYVYVHSKYYKHNNLFIQNKLNTKQNNVIISHPSLPVRVIITFA